MLDQLIVLQSFADHKVPKPLIPKLFIDIKFSLKARVAGVLEVGPEGQTEGEHELPPTVEPEEASRDYQARDQWDHYVREEGQVLLNARFRLLD